MKRDESTIRSLLLNDQFLEYVCRNSESFDDWHQEDPDISLASREDLVAARDIILFQNHDVSTLSSEESQDLKNAIFSTILSPGASATGH